jgi:hypothetical protein
LSSETNNFSIKTATQTSGDMDLRYQPTQTSGAPTLIFFSIKTNTLYPGGIRSHAPCVAPISSGKWKRFH